MEQPADEVLYHTVFGTIALGFSLNEIVCDESGRPCDLRCLMVNPAFERHTGLEAAEVVGRTVRELFPQAEPVWFERFGEVALTGEPAHFAEWFRPLGRCFQVCAFRTRPGRFAAVFTDITEHKLAEESLRESEARCRTANEALERKTLALREVLDTIQEARRDADRAMTVQLETAVFPVLQRIMDQSPAAIRPMLEQLDRNLREIASPFVGQLTSRFGNLTPTEARICQMIRRGLSSKNIARAEGTTAETIDGHRKNIRRKLHIANSDVNLATYLQSIEDIG